MTPGALDLALAPATWVGDPAARIASAVRAGEVSAVEVVDAHLAHIKVTDPELNAFVHVADSARDRAADLDRRARAGERLGPLAGVPVSVKDLIAVSGMPWTAGSRALQHHRATESAPAVARLIKAGAVVVGKTNTPEFGLWWQTDNDLVGPTTSPIAFPTPLSPGGSSGGESAALASGMSALGLGTDFGGSVRWPAHCTGTASARPTPGLVSPHGQLPGVRTVDGWRQSPITPHGRMQQIGPMARTVEDVDLALRVMAVPWARLPATENVDVSALTMGWATGEGTIPVDEPIADAVEQAAALLATNGSVVVPFDTRDLSGANELFGAIRATEQHTELLDIAEPAAFGARMQALLAARTDIRAEQVERLWQRREEVRSRILSTMPDILLLPVASILAPMPGQTSFDVGSSRVSDWDVLAASRAISILGFPVITVPCGLAPDGRPIGLQVIARPWHDHQALAVAAFLERCLGDEPVGGG